MRRVLLTFDPTLWPATIHLPCAECLMFFIELAHKLKLHPLSAGDNDRSELHNDATIILHFKCLERSDHPPLISMTKRSSSLLVILVSFYERCARRGCVCTHKASQRGWQRERHASRWYMLVRFFVFCMFPLLSYLRLFRPFPKGAAWRENRFSCFFLFFFLKMFTPGTTLTVCVSKVLPFHECW